MHESVKKTRSLESTPTHSAVCVSPRPLSSKTHREYYPADSSQLPSGNGVCHVCKGVNVVSRVSELSAVPEAEDRNSHNGSHSELSISSQTDLRVAALEQKVDNLSEVVSCLKLNNELKPPKEIQSCLGIPENFRGRGKSEGQTTMIKKKPPRLGTINKALSAEDVVSMHMYDKSDGECMQCLYVFFQMQHGVTTETELLRSYSPVPSLHTERLECTVVSCRCEYHLTIHNNI